jgi:serine/threonine protein phosphatase 1
MDEEKVFVVGDIHSRLHMLERLMDTIPWHPHHDRLVFIGDYIDRGEGPKGVVDYILALRGSSASVHCLVGNHEVMLLDYLKGRGQEQYFLNGGWRTVESYQGADSEQEIEVPPEHMAFCESLEPFIELDDTTSFTPASGLV